MMHCVEKFLEGGNMMHSLQTSLWLLLVPLAILNLLVFVSHAPVSCSCCLSRDFPFGLCLELFQARNVAHSNKLRASYLARGETEISHLDCAWNWFKLAALPILTSCVFPVSRVS